MGWTIAVNRNQFLSYVGSLAKQIQLRVQQKKKHEHNACLRLTDMSLFPFEAVKANWIVMSPLLFIIGYRIYTSNKRPYSIAHKSRKNPYLEAIEPIKEGFWFASVLNRLYIKMCEHFASVTKMSSNAQDKNRQNYNEFRKSFVHFYELN